MLKYPAFLVLALLALTGMSNGLAAKVLKCPCTFSVSREVRSDANHETFDVIVSPVTSTNKTPLRVNLNHFERHSSRNLRISDAIRTHAGRHIFRNMSIADTGLYRVHIRHHSSKIDKDSPSYDLELHATSRQVRCPVILQPDQPLLTPIRTEASFENVAETLRLNSNINPRIVGGLPISPTLLPYLVAIQNPGTENYCTGTLLSSNWIITAAHCEVAPGFRVLVSTNSNRFGPNTTVTRVFSHPLYHAVPGNARNFYDIAVAELETDLETCTSCVPSPRYMSVNFNTRLPRVQSFTRVAGFGLTFEDRSVPETEPGRLRQVDVPVVDINKCRDIYGTISSENQQVCAGYLHDGECDSCLYDSGGPLVQYTGNVPVLVGVTSFGTGCARAGYPGVYVNTAGHREFLESTPAIFTINTQPIRQTRRRCPRGSYLPFVAGGTSTCTACPDNYMSLGGPVRLCEKCTGNKLRDTKRGDRCSCRALAGYGMVNGQVDCEACRAGSSSRVGQPRCIRCPVDTYAPDAGMAECLPCPGAVQGATTCSTSI